MAINLFNPNVSNSATLFADSGLSVPNSIGHVIQLAPDTLPTTVSYVPVYAGGNTQYYWEPVSAALEVNSVAGGFLPPRLTDAEIAALTPGPGLMVYNLTVNALSIWIATNTPNNGQGNWANFTQGNGNIAGAGGVAGNIATWTGVGLNTIQDSGIQAAPFVAPFSSISLVDGSAISNLNYIQFTAEGGFFYVNDVNPLTLSIHNSNGVSIFTDGLAGNSSSQNAILEIQTTVGCILLSRLTNAQQLEIANTGTLVPGMFLYNTDTHQFQGYAGGENPGWVPATGGGGGGGVTSVGAGAGLMTDGDDPITVSGTISLAPIEDLTPGPVAYPVSLAYNEYGQITSVSSRTPITSIADDGASNVIVTDSPVTSGPVVISMISYEDLPLEPQAFATVTVNKYGIVTALDPGTAPGSGNVVGPTENVGALHNIALYSNINGLNITDSSLLGAPAINVGLSLVSPYTMDGSSPVIALNKVSHIVFPNAGYFQTNTYVGMAMVQVAALDLTTRSNVLIGDNTVTPTSYGAIFEIQSTTGALLLSRMNTTQLTVDLFEPYGGMIAYDNVLKNLYGYVGGDWNTPVEDGGPGQWLPLTGSGGAGVTSVSAGAGLTTGEGNPPIETVGTISLLPLFEAAGEAAYPVDLAYNEYGQITSVTSVIPITEIVAAPPVEGSDYPQAVVTTPTDGITTATGMIGLAVMTTISPGVAYANAEVTLDDYGRVALIKSGSGAGGVVGPDTSDINAIATWGNDVGSQLLNTVATVSPTTGIVTTPGGFVANVGSAAAPSLAFTGDLTAGLYHIGTASVGVSTGGTLALAVSGNPAGNVNYVQITATNGIAPSIVAAGFGGSGQNLELQLSGKGTSYVSILPTGGNPGILGLYNAGGTAALRLSVANILTGYTLQLPAAGAGAVGQAMLATTSGGDTVLSFQPVVLSVTQGAGIVITGTPTNPIISYEGGDPGTVTEITTGPALVATPTTIIDTGSIDMVNLNGTSNTYYFPQLYVDQYGRVVDDESSSLGSYSLLPDDGPANLSIGPNNFNFINIGADDLVTSNFIMSIGSMTSIAVGDTIPVTRNTGMGLGVFGSFYGGTNNTGVGYLALSALGVRGIYNADQYDQNTAVGSGTLVNMQQGYQNTAVGAGALGQLNFENNSILAVGITAIGCNALGVYDPADAGQATNMTVIGFDAGSIVVDGLDSVLIGSAVASAGVPRYENCILIGHAVASNSADEGIILIGDVVLGGGLTSNIVVIGAGANSTENNAFILGNGCNVGIGSNFYAPVYALDINPVQGIQGAIHVANGGTGIVAPPANDFIIYNTVGTPTIQFSGSSNKNTVLSFPGIGAGTAMVPNSPIISVSAQGVLSVISGGEMVQVTEPSAVSYVAADTDCIIGITDTSVARTVTLPNPSTPTSLANQVYVVKDQSGAANVNHITVSVAGGSNIDGSATAVINTAYGSLSFYCNGTQWFMY